MKPKQKDLSQKAERHHEEQPEPDEIVSQLKRIAASAEFSEAANLKAFLTFIVTETLSGRGDSLKQYTVAVNAFDRNDDFDPGIDPIVRIQAGRLRRRLDSYYQKEGKNDPVRIELPKGTYVPLFSIRDEKKLVKETVPEKIPVERKWNYSIVVFPFRHLGPEIEKQYISEGFTEELLMELARYQHLTIIREFPNAKATPDPGKSEAPIAKARFALQGTIRLSGSRVKTSVSLLDGAQSSIVYGKTFDGDLDPERLIDFQEQIAAEVARKIGDIFEGAIFQKILSESRKDSFHDFQAYDALFLFYDYQKHVAPHTFEKAFASTQQALKIDPHFGLGWAIMCNLCTDAVSIDFAEGATSLAQALDYGKKAVALEPDSQMARTILGYCYVINGYLEEGLKQLDRALTLNPGAAYYVGGIGWVMCLAGQYERGIQIMQKAMELNPGYPGWYHMGTCFDLLLQEHYKEALAEAKLFGPAELFWSPLLIAACYGLLGEPEKATPHLEQLLQLKPDFRKKTRYLVSMYAKFEDLQEKIIEGLRKAGL